MAEAVAALAVVCLILLGIVCATSSHERERSFVAASLLAATVALVTVLAVAALHAGGIL